MVSVATSLSYSCRRPTGSTGLTDMISDTLKIVLLGLLAVCVRAREQLHQQAQVRPNVVLIIGDDLNDLPQRPNGKPFVPTLHMDRLASRGVSFTNAHTNDPLCAPSRSSMLFGLYPQTMGLYWFEDWRDNPILKSSVSLPRHLRDHGYSVYKTGKIYHAGQDDPIYEETGVQGNFGPWPWDGKSKNFMLPHPGQQYLLDADPDMPFQWEHCFGSLSNIPDWPRNEVKGIPGYRGWRLFGKPWKINPHGARDLLPDKMSSQWSQEIIAREHDTPFALLIGFVRTHTPLCVPQQYLDRFPLESIELPKVQVGDIEDCASVLTDLELYGFRRFNMLAKHEDRQLYQEWLQAYMACVSFVDDQVGALLDAIDRSPGENNTIVVLTSDHGFHLGEKQFLYKQSLWDGSTRIPLIIAGVKGMAQGKVCDRPISLIDVYPTLNDLCGLPIQPNSEGGGHALDGHSLRPLLMDPERGQWEGPEVAITALPGKDHMQHGKYEGTLYPHFSVRSKRWRYTLCSSGEEELYDYRVDPLEWRNLAHHPEHAAVKEALKAQLVTLRDGSDWKPLDQQKDWRACSEGITTKRAYRDFELEIELKPAVGQFARLVYPARVEGRRMVDSRRNVPATDAALFEGKGDGWSRYRIRVLGGRCQVWINGRLSSDAVSETNRCSGLIGLHCPGAQWQAGCIRNGRIRRLLTNPESDK